MAPPNHSSGVRRLEGGRAAQGMRAAVIDADEDEGGGLSARERSMSVHLNLEDPAPGRLTAGMVNSFRPLASRPTAVDVDTSHGANLVGLLGDGVLQDLGRQLIKEVDAAEQSRSGWRRIMAEGIKRLGFDRQADKRSMPFPGASAVVHPAFAQACIEGQARAEAKLAPPEGPCRTKVVGEPSTEATERADRVADFINYQCLDQIEEWSEETEKLLMMVWAEGSSFKKCWYSDELKRPCSAYIPAENLIVPYHAQNMQTARIVAEKMFFAEYEAQGHVESGTWAPHSIQGGYGDDRGEIQAASDRAVGLEDSDSDVEGQRGLVYYEVQTRRRLPGLDLDERGKPRNAEWLITVAKDNGQVVAIRRNWSITDKLRRRRRLIHHYGAFPWRGFYRIGLYHLIGGLSTAASGALRALLDSAMWQNMPGGFRLKGSRATAGTVKREPGAYPEVDAPGAVKDIRAIIMADPHQGPSPVLFTLLEFLVAECKGFASLALSEVAETNANVPVGTTMARLDEASRVYAGVFRRLHRAQGRELKAIYEIDVATIDEQLEYLDFDAPRVRLPMPAAGPNGEDIPGDFSPGIQIIPVSDPNAHSQIQEALSAQARLTLAREAMTDGVNVNMRDAYVAAGKGMHLNQIDELFPDEPDPIENADPFTENEAMTTGTPCNPNPGQSHDLHLEIHTAMLSLPGTGGTPAGGALLKHIIQHLTMGALTLAAGSVAAKARGLPVELQDPGQWYQAWIERLRPLVAPAATPDVQVLADTEKLKAELKKDADDNKVENDQELLLAESAAKKALQDQQHEDELEQQRVEHVHKMAEIGATQGLANASRERVAAAQIGAKAAEPPKPAPAATKAGVAKRQKS